MSPSGRTGPTPLSTYLKCEKCRASKVKCVPEGRVFPQRCEPCIRGKHSCSPGMPSLRGRRQLLKSPKPSSKRGVTIAIRQKSNTSARRQKSDVKPKQEPDDTTFADVMQVLSSGMPMLIEPSNQRRPHKMTYHMDKRLEQIWGNYKAFAAIKHVSEDFGRITSTFFGITARQMAQTDAMVWESLYACGAADALMNSKLPKHISRDYAHAYHVHYMRGIRLVNAGITEWQRRIAIGENPDVLPLYYAIFMLHSSGACAKSSVEEIRIGLNAVSHLDRYTDQFPLKIELLSPSAGDKGWRICMRLLHYPEDPGMMISRSKFPLGEARVKYDQTAVANQT